jgi:DNA-binding FadR family transcriptional regulator
MEYSSIIKARPKEIPFTERRTVHGERKSVARPAPTARNEMSAMSTSNTLSKPPMRRPRKSQESQPQWAVSPSDVAGPTETTAPSSYVYKRIADEIGSAILCGRRAVGSLLPKEMDAAVDLGVSRTAYREAIRLLIAKGLVEARPKVGTHVTHRRRWQVLDPDVLRWAFQNGPSLAFIQELFELREILEPHAAELAARRRSMEQLALMGHALEKMARHGLATAQGRAADQRFHEEILVATGNHALMTLSASICAAIHWTTVFKHRSAKPPRDAIPDHRRLYAAIVDSDAARAAEAAKELIKLALEDTRASLVADADETSPKKMGRKTR